jgi:hypothetical protein
VAFSFYHHNVEGENSSGRLSNEQFCAAVHCRRVRSQVRAWRDNGLIWISFRGDGPNFMMLRYEEMKRDTAGALLQVVAFMERYSFRKIDSNAEPLQRAIELSSPERMRALEKEEATN